MHISLTDELESRLREQLKAGADQLDRGEGIAIEPKAALDSLFDAITA